MKGLDGLDYMSSTSDSSGSATTTLTFKAGTDIDIAQVQVQNKLQTATALLPQEGPAAGPDGRQVGPQLPADRRHVFG